MAMLALAMLGPCSQPAHAWWDEQWGFRKGLDLDTGAAAANLREPLANVPVLVRLHSGNFGYFLDVLAGGADFRFVDGDDSTPLDFHIERFDAVTGLALVWVEVPSLAAGGDEQRIWMYYGNPAASAAGSPAAAFDSDTGLVFHFSEPSGAPLDATGNASDGVESTAVPNPASLIGGGVRFGGAGEIVVPDGPAIAMDPERGWTVSLWLRPDPVTGSATVLERRGETGALELLLTGAGAVARITDPAGTAVETPPAPLGESQWHHLALVVSASRMALFVDGGEAAAVEASMPQIAGALRLGASAQGAGYLVADMDELRVSRVARSPEWIRIQAVNQGPADPLLQYLGDETRDTAGASDAGTEDAAHGSYFGVIVNNLTFDAKLVIVILALMSAVSLVVMVAKSISLARARGHTRRFVHLYQSQAAEALPGGEEADTTAQVRATLSSLLGRTDCAASPLFRIYERGVGEVHARMGTSAGSRAAGLDQRSVSAIKATLDAVMVREQQRLNAQMVLLTIAISGGPFLGLLGTVVGVMITFAAIAATGDVNITAIAPGMAAALLATTAGLAVAIPALFGYNYLGSRIKELTADMHVFADELMARINEAYGA